MVLKTGCTHHRWPIPWLSWCAVSSVRGHYWVGFFRIHIDNVFVGCMVYVESIVTGEWKSQIFEETKHVSWIHLEENNMNGGKILEGNCFYKFCVFFRERQIVWVWTTHHVKHVEDQKEVMECFVNRLQMFYLFFYICGMFYEHNFVCESVKPVWREW